MTIDSQRWLPHLAALLQDDTFRAALDTQTVRDVQAASATSLPDEAIGELWAAVLEAGKEVLRLEWDCDGPAGSGYARLLRCATCFVLDASDDWPDQGPFSSLEDALQCSAFAQCLADECRITSTLDAKITMVLATQVTRHRRQGICVNGRRWRWEHAGLRAFEVDLHDARPQGRTHPKP